MPKPCEYDDGLDADGYPLDDTSRQHYRDIDEFEPDAVEAINIGKFLSAVLERAEHFSRMSGVTDSPIEDQLGASILMAFKGAEVDMKLFRGSDIPAGSGYLLMPQARWGFYRSDWAIISQATRGVLLIECDGKDFHSSPSQLAHDRTKDQAAADRGWLTMRFTGSQIHREADAIAQRILGLVMQ